jgi:hypothetical protein
LADNPVTRHGSHWEVQRRSLLEPLGAGARLSPNGLPASLHTALAERITGPRSRRERRGQWWKP